MIPTRAAGLEKLAEFLPRAGSKYAISRNFDHGPDDRTNVSGLSPYIRTRLVTEEEIARAVLQRHSPEVAGKFLEEVAWRAYWKGWLEMRPGVWSDYLADLSTLERSPAFTQATEGRTGIACFDAWARELAATGYLHNHARMWFASIWIFTLKLPWQLGAEFFRRHLLDADPASNTLSWRWVAGLHTPGKHYLARAANIAKYTGGRFDPAGQLDESAAPLPPDRVHEIQPLAFIENQAPTGRAGLLLSHEDLTTPAGFEPAATAVVSPEHFQGGGIPATNFLEGAVLDTRRRTGATLLEGDFQRGLRTWAAAESLDSIVIHRPATGPWRDFLATIDFPVPTVEWAGAWDRQLWPKATAGFFKLRKALPAVLASHSPGGQLDLF